MKWTLISILALVLLYAAPVSAVDTFRCGTEVITRGDTKVEAVLSCGEPSYTELLNPGIEGPRVEEWFYNCGSSGFLYVLRFVEGRLQDVKIEGYGQGRSECFGALHRSG